MCFIRTFVTHFIFWASSCCPYCGGVFEQLARSTMRYQESDLHLGLHSSLTSANNLNLPTLLILSTSPTSSSIVAVLIAKAGHVWVS